MRHRYIPWLVVSVVAALVVGVALFAWTTRHDAADEILAIDGDPVAGATVFREATVPVCADCHALADAGATGGVGPDLDDVAPDRARVVAVLAEGAPPPRHEEEGLRLDLSPRQIADVAAYLDDATGDDG